MDCVPGLQVGAQEAKKELEVGMGLGQLANPENRLMVEHPVPKASDGFQAAGDKFAGESQATGGPKVL